MSDIKDSVLLSTSHEEKMEKKKKRENVKKNTRNNWRDGEMIHIVVFKLLQLFRLWKRRWGLVALFEVKQILHFYLIHTRRDNKNLWPYVFNSAWGKLSRKVVGSSSHEATKLGCLCQNWGWIKWQESGKRTSSTTEPWGLNYSPPRLPLNPCGCGEAAWPYCFTQIPPRRQLVSSGKTLNNDLWLVLHSSVNTVKVVE